MKTFLVPFAVAVALASTPQASAQERSAAPTIAFRNDLPGTYQLRRVRLWVDGALVHEGWRPFDAALAPGEHLVSIAAEYRMRDPLLPYVRGYSIQLRSAEHIRSDRSRTVFARALESGGVTVPIDRRARIAWH